MILGRAEDPDKAYIEQIMPNKIRYNMKWIENQGVVEYFKIIFSTFGGLRGEVSEGNLEVLCISVCSTKKGERRILSYRHSQIVQKA